MNRFQSSRSRFSIRSPKSVGILAILILAVSFLSGCASSRLRIDYRGYESAVAESGNRQLLLNLARLNQHDPTYFFKFGPISTSYRIQGTVSTIGQQVAGAYANPLAQSITGGGSPATLLEQDPTFTFIPISDDTIAQQLLQPIQAAHFYILFQQGWRLDQLMRLMVNRVEFKPSTTSDSIQVIRNSPSSDNIAGYLTFLRISALAYELQRKGHLVVTGKSHYHVIMTNLDLKTIEAKDITDAQAKGLTWKKTADGKYWELGQTVVDPEFKLNPPNDKDAMNSKQICPQGIQAQGGFQIPNASYYNPPPTPQEELIACEISNDSEVKELAVAQSLIPALRIIEAGFIVTGESTAEIQTEETQLGSAQFVMRSLIGAMAAASEEEDVFNAVMTDPTAKRQDPIPQIEKQPLMRLTWRDEKDPLTPSLVELDYQGKTYRIADVKNQTDNPLNQDSWNRDMFRIISQLSSQVTVDLSKFPLPTILQLRPQ